MIVSKSFKIRIYPNKTQSIMIDKNIGCARFVYNKMLEEKKFAYETYKDDKRALWEYKYKTEKDLKTEFSWLSEAESSSLQQARIDLSRSLYQLFCIYFS